MSYLFVLLLYIIGLLLTDINLIALNIALILFTLFLIIFKIKKRKKPLIIATFFFALGILQTNLKLPEERIKDNVAFVVKKSENYALIRIKAKRYITYDLDNSRLFDVVRVSGFTKSLNVKTFESGFNFEEYLNHNGVDKELVINNYEVIVQNPIDNLAYQQKVINRYDKDESKSLVKALLFGKQEGVSKEISDKLLITSLLSTSGFFITFILYGISKFLGYFMYTSQAKIFTFIIFLPFLFFNIDRFTVVRCATFFLFHILNEQFNFKFDGLKRQSLMYLMFLFFNHYLIYSKSYYIPLIIALFLQFSYLFLKHEDSNVTNRRRKVLIISILFPFIIEANNCFNLVSMLITFTCSFYFKGLFLLAYFSFFGLYFSFFDNIFAFSANFLDKIDIKYLNINVPKFGALGFVIYYLILISFLFFKEVNFKTMYKKVFIFGVSVFCINLLPIKNAFTCEVSFINIGQGDSTLIRYGNKSYLIDTGGNLYTDLARESLIPYFRSKKIYKLDSVFITHYDFDHYGALESLKNNFIIDEIYDYNSTFPVKKGPLVFENLNHFWNEDEQNENNKSLVFKMKIGEKVFLFMGDSPSGIEKELLKTTDVKCDILKLGHHGSKDSSCMEFLKATDPEMAIISCGKGNKYHHPNKETIARLNALKIPYRRTDKESTITYQFKLH